MVNVLKKFTLIMWKNLLIRKRHWLLTIFEIATPILLFLLMAYIRGQLPALSKEYNNQTTIYPPMSFESSLQNYEAHGSYIYYAPNHPFYQTLMEKLRIDLKIPNGMVIGFDNEQIMDSNITESAVNNEDEQVIAIIFSESTANGDPKKFDYTIRTVSYWDTRDLFPSYQMPGPMNSNDRYTRTGFLPIQMGLDSAYIQYVSKKSLSDMNFEIETQQFPYPPYMKDMGFDQIFGIFLPLITVVSFLFLCPSLLKRVVEEKETGIKELMKLMGLKEWMLWIGWLFHALVTYVFSITVIVCLLKMGWTTDAQPVIAFCSPILLWIFLILYTIAGISFCFFISTLFERPTIAMCVGEIAWLLSYFILNSWASNPKLGLGSRILGSLLPNIAMMYGFKNIAAFEARNVGLQFSNLFQSPSGSQSELSMGGIFGMLIVEILFYGILTWYIDSIKPGQYGLARPWYFPFTPSYWINGKVESSETAGGFKWNDVKNYEEPSSHLIPGIKIRNLKKRFGNKTAVNGLTMDFYRGEITALLGHNGAGKTTTMSILTGMFSPSSGNVSISDYNLRTQLSRIRESLGLCPQHNMLFTDLTVMEHLLFFSKLKGASPREADSEAKKLLNTLQLSEKSNTMPGQLSGGMQRKLSLAIALIGNSKVLMLDEPTSGMDPEARRHVWDLLLQMRHPEKTIIITTHFMEEADVLGDRIAIMDHGMLQCFGTSMYLKKKYGAGYQLSIMKSNSTDIEAVTSAIASHIPEVRLKNQNPTLLTYSLPTTQNEKLPALFQTLEKRKQSLDITGVGLSVTTLEEVFLRVGELAEEDSPDKKSNYGDDQIDGSNERLLNDEERNKGCTLEFERLKALLIKKFLFAKRKYIYFTMLSLFPVLLTIGVILLCQAANHNDSNEPALTLTIDKYGSNTAYYSPGSTNTKKISDIYGKLLPKNVGVSTQNVTSKIVEVGTDNIVTYREMLVIAADFTENRVRAMYSSIALHSLPISWNLVSNAILKSLVGEDYQITATNRPLDRRSSAAVTSMIDQQQIVIITLWVLLFPLGLMFALGSFVSFPLTERVSKIKQLQLMTGLHPYLYWLACYLFDMVIYLIIIVAVTISIPILDKTGTFSGFTELSILFLLMLLYGLSGIVYSYVISIIRPTVAGSFSLLMITNLVIVIVVAMCYGMLLTNDSYWQTVGYIIEYIGSLIPHFPMSLAILKFTKTAVDNNKCKQMDPVIREMHCSGGYIGSSLKMCCDLHCPPDKKCTKGLSYFSGDDDITFQVIMLFLDIFILFGIILLIELFQVYNCKELILKQFAKKKYPGDNRRDSDVEKESLRVDNCLSRTSNEQDNLLVHRLEKRYGLSHFAVRGVSFGVHAGECFGLLGVNGAGKTSTFKMITGDEPPTHGDAMANLYRLSKNRTQFLSQLGYCPQFDAINESLTGKEMLYVFARLRGVPSHKLAGEVTRWLYFLGLREYKDRLCGTYSGGNKRKLSTAMALIGEPPIVLLDEPTSGVDPISRRSLWDVLSKIQKQSIILTSHSMEECEALCNRLAIMVNGQFVCVGTVQYLKQRFGQGYTIILKLRSGGTVTSSHVNNLKLTIESEFPCEIKDEHEGLLHYHVTDAKIKWFELFNRMEKVKNESNGLVEDYTISETTLEQVFLSFARQQKGEHLVEPNEVVEEIPAIADV